ncbi:hypothetical protein [Butyrivibrio sp. XPD2006]|uniref:hypothetical protein n=1 Tax=Butyrivibrio sp. XPD2006 TaxID=1280668 RepID=UPI0003B5E244|nr:hypothetical protein [Butyrivibrio sp. XPD2006]
MKRAILTKTGVAISASMLLMTSMPCTAFAEEGANGAAATTTTAQTEAVAQEDSNATIGYNVADTWLEDRNGHHSDNQGLNVYRVDENGNHVQSTYRNSCYDTLVSVNGGEPTPVSNSGSFEYGTAYDTNGISTTITPELDNDAVRFTYNVQNNTDQEQEVRVGSAADIMVGPNRSDDFATIYGDSTGFTMTNGTNAMEVNTDPETPFDNLWYGYYGQVLDHFNDEPAVREDRVENIDSGVVWGWVVNLLPGQSASRTAGFRIGAHEVVVTRTMPAATPAAPAEAPAEAPVNDEQYATEKQAPVQPDAKVWTALTQKGEQLPIQNMGVAEVTTSTLFVDITGASAVQYKDVVKATYEKAPSNGAFVLGTTEVSVVDQEMIDTLSSRNDVTVEVVFPYNDQVLMVKIPGGSDYSSVLDETGYAGYLKLASVFGATVLE